MSSWAPDTSRMGVEEIAARINTNRLLREEHAFHHKQVRTHKFYPVAICASCEARIFFDGVIWFIPDTGDINRRHICRAASRAAGSRRPHEPANSLSLKDLARARVFEALKNSFDRAEPLSILTMPGLQWSLERRLLDWREGAGQWGRDHKSKTTIIGIEKSDPVYRASALSMPGRVYGVTTDVPPPFATYAISSTKAQFYRADVTAALDHLSVAAAWIDLTGPMTTAVMRSLLRSWLEHRISRLLIITSLKARWTKPLADEIGMVGLSKWLTAKFGPKAVDIYEYAEPAPMHQICFLRDDATTARESA